MQSKRTVFLAGLLVVLSLGFVGKVVWNSHLERMLFPPPDSKPLPGENSISNIVVKQNDQGQWFVDFDYFFTGDPTSLSVVFEVLGGDSAKLGVLPQNNPYISAQRGKHHITHELKRPAVAAAVTASQIRVRLISWYPQQRDVVTQTAPINISWLDMETSALHDELRTKSADEFLRKIYDLIDAGDGPSLSAARKRLQLFLEKQPQSAQAYLELARVAMRTNWGPEGLRQAEAYVDTARKISPEDPNVWILQGYVYAYQGRYKEAEPLLVAASKTDTSNLWLWTNWGELHLLQGKLPQAIDMFRKAVDAPPPGNTYDRARKRAYWQLFKILDKKSQLDLAESLYEKRYADYNSVACYGAEFAQFMLMKRGNVARAAELAGQTAIATCEDPNPKEILGMAHYVSWAGAQAAEQTELLNRARVVFPSGTRLIYMLASSDHTAKALKALQSSGESIDQLDNRKMNALAYALSNKDHDTVRRLLRLKARTDLEIGAADILMALIPVISEDYEGIKLLRQFGVDYAKIKYQDMTAIDHAKRIENRKLLEAVGGYQSQRL
jgi:tetratricopeptide (TPR) repeat protein